MTTPYSEPWERKTRAHSADLFAQHGHAPTHPVTPPPVKDTLDQELAAMRTINVVLSRLDPEVRGRVLSWAYSRADAMRQVPASATRIGGDTPFPAHTVDDIPPLTGGKTDDIAADYEWPMVSVYLKEPKPIIGDLGDHGDYFTVKDARQYATELLCAAHRVDTHTETT